MTDKTPFDVRQDHNDNVRKDREAMATPPHPNTGAALAVAMAGIASIARAAEAASVSLNGTDRLRVREVATVANNLLERVGNMVRP